MNRLTARHLGLSLIFAIALIATGALLVRFAHQRWQAATRTNADLAGSISGLEDRYRQTAQEEPLIRAAILRFDEMRRRGVIGDAARLDWAEHMRAIHQRLRLQDASFAFGPQRSEALSPGSAFALNTSRMAWHARLLHEGDFLRALDQIRQAPNALVVYRQCALTSLPSVPSTGNEPTDLKYSLVADCELDWVTMSAAVPQDQATGSSP